MSAPAARQGPAVPGTLPGAVPRVVPGAEADAALSALERELLDRDRLVPVLPADGGLVPPPVPPATGEVRRSAVEVEVVIPAYNESRRLPATLAATVAFLARQPWTSRVVVVDNGSSDDTAAGTRRLAGGAVDVVTIGCSRPGKGAAVLRGLRTSSARFVCFADADLSTPVETLLPALAALRAGAAAVVASRHAPGAELAVRQPLARRLGGQLFRAVAGDLVPGVHDTQCGFKVFDRDAVEAVLWRCTSQGFAFDVELLRRISDAGGRIVELPVTWTDDGGSTLRPLRDGVGAVLAVARLRAALASPRKDAR
jgi:hypothetical protein